MASKIDHSVNIKRSAGSFFVKLMFIRRWKGIISNNNNKVYWKKIHIEIQRHNGRAAQRFIFFLWTYVSLQWTVKRGWEKKKKSAKRRLLYTRIWFEDQSRIIFI